MHEQLIIKCLKNLGATHHATSLIRSRFYDALHGQCGRVVAEVVHNPSSNFWEIKDGMGKALLGVSFSNRLDAIRCMASDDFGFIYNYPTRAAINDPSNLKTLASCFRGKAWA